MRIYLQEAQKDIEKLQQMFKQQDKTQEQNFQTFVTQRKEQTRPFEKLKECIEEKDKELRLLNQKRIKQLEEKDQQITKANQLVQYQAETLQCMSEELQTIKQEKNEQMQIIEQRETSLQHLQQENAELKLQIEYPSWVVKKKDITLSERELGRGAYGWVKEATYQGCRVAVKCLHKKIISPYNLKIFNREMDMAARCCHPNLLQFIGATSKGEGNPFIVTELMHTSLRWLLEHEQLSSNHIIPIMLGIALGLNYLHKSEPPILHRDVSSANVLLNPLPSNQWFPKLSDFGSLNFLQQSETINAGNPAYAAPEALDPKKGSHTPAMDTFSFGVLLHELCSRTQPMGGLTPENIKHSNWKTPESQLVSLIISCIDQKISGRPKMDNVVAQLKPLTKSM